MKSYKHFSLMTILFFATTLAISCTDRKTKKELPQSDKAIIESNETVLNVPIENIDSAKQFNHEGAIYPSYNTAAPLVSVWRGFNIVDTVVDKYRVKFGLFESYDSVDYVDTHTYNRLNSKFEVEEVRAKVYGNVATIVLGLNSREDINNDTIYITRSMLVDSMNVPIEPERNPYMINDIELDCLRNDSIIFFIDFSWKDTDIVWPARLKIIKNDTATSLKVECIHDEWSEEDWLLGP